MRKLPALIVVALLGGCATTTPEVLDSKFGDAVNMAKAQQTLHPEASQNTQPVEGIDGKSADALINRYHKGFEAPPAPNIFSIGVGGSGGTTLNPAATSQ
jgi:hypothetical protein